MKDFSTSCKKFNMYPGSRLLTVPYEKTVIVVASESLSGKSTICEKLLNDDLCFVCTDSICIGGDSGIKSIDQYLEDHKEDKKINIGLMGIAISESEDYKEFVDFFFQKYILDNDSDNILLEGHLITLENIQQYFLHKCKENKVRVWVMERRV